MKQQFFICPHLGLKKDPQDRATYPHESNACFALNSSPKVILSYQDEVCLDISHINCPGYINGWIDGMPMSLCQHKHDLETAPKLIRLDLAKNIINHLFTLK